MVFIFKKPPDGCTVVPCTPWGRVTRPPPRLWVWLIRCLRVTLRLAPPRLHSSPCAGPQACETGRLRAGSASPVSAGARPGRGGRPPPTRRGAVWAGSTRESWLPRPPYGSNFAVVSFISFSIWARVLSQRNEVTAPRRAGTRERSGRQSSPARRPPAWPWGAVAVGQAALRGGGCVSGPPAYPARAWVSLQPRGPAAAGPLPGTWQRPRSPCAPLPRSRGRSRACASRRREDLHHPCQVHRGLLVSPYIFRNVTEYSAVIN